MPTLILLTNFLILYSLSVILGCPRSNFPKLSLIEEENEISLEARAVTTVEPIVPNYYGIDITIGSLKSKKLSGILTMKFTCNKETKKIKLNAYEMMVNQKSVSLQLDNGNDLTRNIKKVSVTSSSITITLSQSIKINKKYRLIIPYEVKSSKVASFYTTYTDGEDSRYYALLPQGDQSAADVFPCIPKNTLPAVFEVNVTRPKEMKSLSNMEIQETTCLCDRNLQKDIYKPSPIMTTVSITIILHTMSWESLSTPRGFKIQVFSPVDKARQRKIPLKYMTKCIERIEAYFELDLPINKIDAFPVPGLHAAALSSLGNILFLDSELLLELESGPDTLKFATDTFCHELTHQYFGGLVFSDEKENGMITEAFANYMGYYIMSGIEPGFHMEENFLLKEMQFALVEDASNLSHPLTVFKPYPNTDRDYVDLEIGYNKGASVLRMLNDTMGKDNFQAGVNKFLHQYLHKPYKASDMWTTLSQFTDGPLAKDSINFLELCNSWTLQMGYPVLTVERDYDADTITLSQMRYIDNVKTESLPNENYPDLGNWYIPAKMVGLNQKYGFKILTTTTEIYDDVSIKPDDFLIVNENRFGFYRVNYDQQNWELITQQLQSSPSAIQVIQRAALLDDAFKLAEYCFLDIKTALDLTKYLNAENEYTPLKNALDNIRKVYTNIYHDKVARANMQKYVISKLKPLYNKFDWKDMKFDNPLKNTRQIVFETVCLMNEPDCVEKSKKIYESYLDNYPDDTSLEDIAKCTAIRNDQRTWKNLFDSYKDKPRFNDLVENGLICSENPDFIKSFIDYTLSPKITGFSKVQYLKGIAANPAAATLLWGALNSKFNGILNNEEDSDALKALPILVQNVDSLEVAQVNSFTNYKKTYKGDILIKKALNTISGNAHWKKCNQDAAIKWLSDTANLNNVIPNNGDSSNDDSSNDIDLEDDVETRKKF